MKLVKKISEKFLYSNEQIGLVFLLLFTVLLLLPSSIYVMVFYTSITTEEVNFYSKYGAIFTTIGAVFTIINTFLVIYLMFFFHKKEVDISIFPYITDLKKNLVDIELVIKSEIDYFNDTQFETYEKLNDSKYDLVFNSSEYDDVFKTEIQNLEEIITEVESLYSNFSDFKKEINNQPNINMDTYKEKISIINNLNESIILQKPSSKYKKSFIEGNKYDIDSEILIQTAKQDSMEAIINLKQILKNTK